MVYGHNGRWTWWSMGTMVDGHDGHNGHYGWWVMGEGYDGWYAWWSMGTILDVHDGQFAWWSMGTICDSRVALATEKFIESYGVVGASAKDWQSSLSLLYLWLSQLQLQSPISTRRKMRRKKRPPETPYTMAEVMEMDTESTIFQDHIYTALPHRAETKSNT